MKLASQTQGHRRRVCYNYRRDYDPITGRYVESDPIGLHGGVNTYGYVRGNSTNRFDPYGLWDWPSLPQGVVDVGVGLGDGVLAALTYGRVSGQDVRDLLNIQGNGGANTCSREYKLSYLFGVADAVASTTAAALAGQNVRSATQATYLSLELMFGNAEAAASGTEITTSIEQLQSIVEMAQERAAAAGVRLVH